MNTKLQDIMMVEDDVDIQNIAQLSLNLVGGFSVTVCGSGEEALKKLQSLTPQLILLDVMMPGMDGPTVLEHIKQIPHFKGIPVIFMTAKIHPNEVEHYLKLGACGVISKPFDPMELPNIITEIWEKNSLHHSP